MTITIFLWGNEMFWKMNHHLGASFGPVIITTINITTLKFGIVFPIDGDVDRQRRLIVLGGGATVRRIQRGLALVGDGKGTMIRWNHEEVSFQ